MMRLDDDSDGFTVSALGLTAMCLVTFDHEALGHGGMCLAIGGHIEVLTSSIFRCNVRSVLIDPAGPLTNVLAGGLALLLASWIPGRLMAARLLFTLVAAFSFFWESGYLIKAMLGGSGDLYFAAEDFLGEPSRGWRVAGTLVGIGLYLVTIRWVSRALIKLFPRVLARRAARMAWTAATLGAALAAILDVRHGWAGFGDAVLEIGGASVPLLFTAGVSGGSAPAGGFAPLRRDWRVIGSSLGIYALFVATLGRGLYF
jgi:hypothetical protein